MPIVSVFTVIKAHDDLFVNKVNSLLKRLQHNEIVVLLALEIELKQGNDELERTPIEKVMDRADGIMTLLRQSKIPTGVLREIIKRL